MGAGTWTENTKVTGGACPNDLMRCWNTVMDHMLAVRRERRHKRSMWRGVGRGKGAGAGRDGSRADKDCVWQWVRTHVRSAYAGKSPIHWRDTWSISVGGGGLPRGSGHVDKEEDAELGRMG